MTNLADTIDIVPFASGVDEKSATTLDHLGVLQINVGKLCNLACKHCHVEAGPNRSEVMSKETMLALITIAKEWGFETIDITGGAPEMNPNFRWFVDEMKKICNHIIVRSNIVIFSEPEYADIPQFLADRDVEIFASLPYYRAKETDRVRGSGTFDSVIDGLQKLNDLGYGRDETHVLNLIYNPAGAFMPPVQSAMEAEYKARLKADFGIDFNNLYCITNNPTGRFAKFLESSGNLDYYMRKLESSFNPATLPSMMCRNQLSVGWDGKLYDCDFNQAADLPIKSGESVFDVIGRPYKKREIAFGNHCYGCCAGQGSSCGGATE